MGLFDKFKKKPKGIEEDKKAETEKITSESDAENQPEKTEEVPPAGKAVISEEIPHATLSGPANVKPEWAEMNRVLGFVLLKDKSFDLEQFKLQLKEDWRLEPEIDVKNNGLMNLTFMIAGMHFVVTHMPAPVPNQEVERAAQYNILWKEAKTVAAEHQSFLVVAIVKNPSLDKVKTYLNFTKICGSLTALPNVSAVYMGGQHLMISPQEYRHHVAFLQKAIEKKETYLPIPLWIYFGLVRGEKGGYAYTYGLKDFGRMELELLDTPLSPLQAHQILNMLCYMSLTENVVLKNNDRVRLDKNQFVVLKQSKGVMMQVDTLKVFFAKSGMPTPADIVAPTSKTPTEEQLGPGKGEPTEETISAPPPQPIDPLQPLPTAVEKKEEPDTADTAAAKPKPVSSTEASSDEVFQVDAETLKPIEE